MFIFQASDVMFRLEDSRVATDIIEQAIAYMQYAALPSFNLLDVNLFYFTNCILAC